MPTFTFKLYRDALEDAHKTLTSVKKLLKKHGISATSDWLNTAALKQDKAKELHPKVKELERKCFKILVRHKYPEYRTTDDGEGIWELDRIFRWWWRIRGYLRQMDYRVNNVECLPLPPYGTYLWNQDTVDDHARMIERLMLLRDPDHSPSQDLYAEGGIYHATESQLSRDTAKLPEKYRWMAEDVLLRNPEWHIFFSLVSDIGKNTAQLDQTIHILFLGCREYKLLRNCTLDSVTTPCKPSDPESRGECPICRYEFPLLSDTEESNADSDVPVKTACGHVLGKACLAAWFEFESEHCPYCRQRLASEESQLPSGIRYHIELIRGILNGIRDMDADIDKYLLAGYEAIHDPGFGGLLHSLAKLWTEYCRVLTRCAEVMHRMGTVAAQRDVDAAAAVRAERLRGGGGESG